MLDFSYLSTFSGILCFLAVFAALNRRPIAAGLLLTIAGGGGVGVFWERWSKRAGDDVHVVAILHPVTPTAGEASLLVTHLSLLVAGVIIVARFARRPAVRGSGV